MSVTHLDTISNAPIEKLQEVMTEYNESLYEIQAYEIQNSDIIRFHNEHSKNRKVERIHELSLDELKAVEREVKALDDEDGTLYSYRDYLRHKQALEKAKEEQPEF